MQKKLDGFHLKIIAITGMLINHMGILFEWSHSIQTLPLYVISEFVGKFTFPIMAYLLVEGYHYTKDVKKYAIRLAIFWVISIYPFYLLRNPVYSFSLMDIPNNIFFTLLMGLIMLVYYDKIKSTWGHFLLIILFIFLTILSDWNVLGIILIWAFYKFHNDRGIKIIMFALFLIIEIVAVVGVFIAPNSLSYVIEFLGATGFLAVGYLLLNYNGNRGYSPRWVKWGFYAFYPLHLIFLEFVKYLFF